MHTHTHTHTHKKGVNLQKLQNLFPLFRRVEVVNPPKIVPGHNMHDHLNSFNRMNLSIKFNWLTWLNDETSKTAEATQSILNR